MNSDISVMNVLFAPENRIALLSLLVVLLGAIGAFNMSDSVSELVAHPVFKVVALLVIANYARSNIGMAIAMALTLVVAMQYSQKHAMEQFGSERFAPVEPATGPTPVMQPGAPVETQMSVEPADCGRTHASVNQPSGYLADMMPSADASNVRNNGSEVAPISYAEYTSVENSPAGPLQTGELVVGSQTPEPITGTVPATSEITAFESFRGGYYSY
jgi:hypothetical protein